MKQELKFVTGEIQNVRKDRKAFSINNIWYSQFKGLDDNLQKGLIVEVGYLVNAKGYNNIQLINFPKIIEEPIREHNKVSINDTTINTILMISKDIYIETIKANKTQLIPQFEETLEDVFDSYNKIIRGKK